MSNLNNSNILILSTNGFQEDELFQPLEYFREHGATVHLASPETDEISAGGSDSRSLKPDLRLEDVSVDNYDALILPGGLANPDSLRQNEKAIHLIREFGEQGKAIGAICHAPWLLAEAGLTQGRELTSYPSIKTDMENAGAHWVNKEVVCDNAIVTSRKPEDIPAFCRKLAEEIREGDHDRNLQEKAA